MRPESIRIQGIIRRTNEQIRRKKDFVGILRQHPEQGIGADAWYIVIAGWKACFQVGSKERPEVSE